MDADFLGRLQRYRSRNRVRIPVITALAGAGSQYRYALRSVLFERANSLPERLRALGYL